MQDFSKSNIFKFLGDNVEKGKSVSDLLPNIILGDYSKDLSFNHLPHSKEENESKVALFGFLTVKKFENNRNIYGFYSLYFIVFYFTIYSFPFVNNKIHNFYNLRFL